MADQVHSRNSSTIPDEYQSKASQEHAVPRNPIHPASDKPVPPSPEQTYIIQIPRDEVIRFPPSDNVCRREQYVRRKNRRSLSCCLISLVIIAIAIPGGVAFHLIRPRYTIERISIHGMNLTSTESQAISPEFDIALRVKNLNIIFGIHYQKDSSVKVYYKELRLVDGALPAFYQPSDNETVFQTALKASGVVLTSTDAKALGDAQNKRIVPLTLRLKAPVKLKAWGSFETWKMTATGNCLITVDSLTAQANVVSKNCVNHITLWG